MSGVLARLRFMFNDELLVRVGRQMERTPLAEDLIEPLRACIRDVELLLSSRLTFNPATENRMFNIATSDYLSFLLLGPLIEQLSERAPGISLRIMQVDDTRVDQLANDVIDFVIMPSEISLTLPSKMVWKDNQEVGDTFTENQYLQLPHLVSGQESSGVADGHLNRLGVQRHIGASVQSFLLAPFVISGTRMVTLIHRRLGERLSHCAGIRLIEPPFEFPIIRESIFWNPRHTNNPSHTWMIEQISEVAAKI
jgi:DNA-binding transcriptional LysR family regulator